MRITTLTTNDYERFYSLRLASLQDCPEEFATDAEAWKNAAHDTINKLLIDSEQRRDMSILGAWKNDDLVGLVGVRRDLRPSVMHKSTLWGYYVTPDHRRQGLGSALLDEVIRVAQQTPYLRLIRAVVTVTSRDALSLLEKKGFERYGHEPEAKRWNDRYYDQIYLWLSLHA